MLRSHSHPCIVAVQVPASLADLADPADPAGLVGPALPALQVYLHEISDPRYTALTGSLGYVSLGVGVVIGEGTCTGPTDALRLCWGWQQAHLLGDHVQHLLTMRKVSLH